MDIDLGIDIIKSSVIKERDNTKYNRKRFKDMDTYFDGKNSWLIKPTGYNRGRGIRYFNEIETLVGYL